MKFPKIPKSLEWLAVGLAVVTLVMNPGKIAAAASPEGMLRKLAYGAVILAAYYLGGVYVAGAVTLFLVFQQSKEGMENEGKAIEGTQCPPKFDFDIAAQMCKNKDTGALVNPTQVVCASGFKPNETNDKCVQETPAPAPPPPSLPKPTQPAEPPASSTGSATANSAAPANSTEGFEGKGTVATTPGEAQDKAKGTVVLQQQGGVEPFSLLGAAFPLQ